MGCSYFLKRVQVLVNRWCSFFICIDGGIVERYFFYETVIDDRNGLVLFAMK